MFQQILAAPGARFLGHCAAGKDRTGFAAAIILLALGTNPVAADAFRFANRAMWQQRVRSRYVKEVRKKLPFLNDIRLI